MKKIVLSALLLAVCFTVSAQAYEPVFRHQYRCWSSDGSKNGTFVWTERTRANRDFLIIWGYESFNFQNPTPVAWAKPMPKVDQPNKPTVWEYTLSNVAQCQKTTVSPDRRTIFFEQCSDVSTRFCLLFD